MAQPFTLCLLHIPPVSGRRSLSELLPPFHHREQTRIPHKPNHRNRDIRIPITHGAQPRIDGVVDRKTQGISDQYTSDHHPARQFPVRRDGVVECGGNTESIAHGEQELAEDEAEPVDMVGDAETVEDHGEGDEDHGADEKPEGVFWF